MKKILVDPNLVRTFFGNNFFDSNYGAINGVLQVVDSDEDIAIRMANCPLDPAPYPQPIITSAPF